MQFAWVLGILQNKMSFINPKLFWFTMSPSQVDSGFSGLFNDGPIKETPALSDWNKHIW